MEEEKKTIIARVRGNKTNSQKQITIPLVENFKVGDYVSIRKIKI